MRWLGDNREAVEEALFHRRRDLFTECTLAFFDTTSMYTRCQKYFPLPRLEGEGIRGKNFWQTLYLHFERNSE